MGDSDYSDEPALLKSDNNSAIDWALSENPPSTHPKQIDVRLHFIRDIIQKSIINHVFVRTEANDKDKLTKPVNVKVLEKALQRILLGSKDVEEC